ncbi:MAG: serine/threonine protein phosphatase [Phycisphaerales bacterium]|nr:serine/threonine protein phosphatase [Phycisphaerales bacterium]MCB9862045.1 serine/threonine protein phosphatase [Phycisphaerales bacterium]
MPNHPQRIISTRVESAGSVGQDRVAVIPCDTATVVVVADGAGGSDDGGRAADFVVDAIRQAAGAGGSDIGRGLYWQDVLLRADRALAALASGETTAIVVAIMDEHMVGASVGDSQAWLIAGRDVDVLTERQRRKPLIGDGGAMPVAFERVHLGRTLLVGSDGLFNYVPLDRMLQIVASEPVENAPNALIDAARLRSGALQDDIGVVIAS